MEQLKPGTLKRPTLLGAGDKETSGEQLGARSGGRGRSSVHLPNLHKHTAKVHMLSARHKAGPRMPAAWHRGVAPVTCTHAGHPHLSMGHRQLPLGQPAVHPPRHPASLSVGLGTVAPVPARGGCLCLPAWATEHRAAHLGVVRPEGHPERLLHGAGREHGRRGDRRPAALAPGRGGPV